MTNMDKKLTGNGHKQAAQASLQLLPLIMNNIPQAVFWKDQNLVYLGCNQAFVEDAGFSSPDEIVGKTDFDMPWKDQAELYHTDDRRVLDSGEPKLNYEEPQTTPGGSTIWLRTSKIPVYENEQIVAILGMYEDVTAQKQVELDLLLRDRALASSLNAVIILGFPDNKPIYTNDALLKMTGYSFEEVKQITLADITGDPEELSKIRAAVQTQGFFVGEERIKRKDGSSFPANFFTSLIKDNKGQPVAIQSSFFDITERKQAEAALQESQSLYQSLVEASPLSICCKDLEGRFTFANQRFLEVSQTTLADLLGKTDAELHPSDLADKYRSDDLAVMQSGKVHELVEERSIHKGETAIVQTIKAPIYDGTGKINGVQISFWDVTDRERADDAVQASEERFRRFTEATSEGLVFHEQGTIIDANPSALAMFGFSDNSEFLGKSLLEFLKPEFHEIVLKQMQLEAVAPYEVLCIRNDGSAFPVETSTRTYKQGDRVIRATSIRDITERKRAETDLLLRDRALASSFSAVILLDLNFKPIYVNEAFLKLTGYSYEEAMQLAVPNLTGHPEGIKRIDAAVEAQGFFSGEELIKRKDGSIFPTDFFTSYITNDKGEPIAIQTAFTDITERKRTEDELKRNANFTSALLDAIPTPVFYKDKEGRYQGCNRAFAEIMGKTAEEIRGKTVHQLWPSANADVYHQKDIELMQNAEHQVYESTTKDKNGNVRPIIFAKDVFYDESGNVAGLVGAFIDITESKRAEQALQESQKFLQTVMDNIPQSIFWKDNNLTYLGCNSAFAADAGIQSPADIPGKTDWDMPWKEQAELYRADDSQVMKSGVPKLNYEEPQTNAQGQTTWLRTSKIPLYDNEGNVFAVLGMYEDITERKRIEERLNESEERYRRLSDATVEGIVIHDKGILLDSNDTFAKMFGYELSEVIGMAATEFLTPETREITVQNIRSGYDKPYEVMGLRKDGSTFPVEITGRMIPYEGRMVRVAALRDISERKQAEEATRKSEEKFRTVADFTYSWETWLSPEGQFIYVSPACERISEYPPNVFMDNPDLFGEIAFPEDRQLVEDHLHEHRSTAETHPIEFRIITKNGKVRWINHVCQPIYNADGTWQGRRGSNIDITERKLLEMQVQTALARRGLQVQLSTQVSQSIAAAASLGELYERVVTQVKEEFGYYHTQLLRYDTVQDAVVLVTGYGETGAKMLAAGHRLPMGEGLIGSAAASGETVLRPALENDPDWHPNPLLPETKGEIAVPIKLGDTVLGVLDVQSAAANALDADDQLLLEGLCGQIAIAIESTRLRQDMSERMEEINRLYRAMSREGWQTFREKTDVESGFMYDQAGLRLIQDVTLAEELFATVPLTVPGGEVIGNLAIADDPQRPLTSEDETFLQQVSEQVALALESARLFEQTQSALNEVQRRASELKTVATVSTTASSVLDPDQLLQSVVDLAKERFSLYHAHIYTYDQSWNTLLLAAGAGEVGRKLVAEEHAIPLTLEQSLVARAARERKPIIVNDVNSEPGFLPNPLLPETRAEMAVPMTVGDTLLGVFDVQSNSATGFSDEDANIYVTLASQVGVALQNARSYVEQAALVTQLRELDRLKSSFLANMSHELRTPLNSILGFADVIIEELDGPLTENMTNDLRLIQKNGQHLLHLINDVLDMAKIEAGRMNLNPEKFTAFEVIEEVTSITSTLASEKNLALFIEPDSDQKVQIYADRTRLRQVMINLVNNAIKFTENGKISLKLAALDGARVLYTIKDTGIGIPPDKLDAIFQEFTQVDSSTTRKAGGTGLGLPISRRLVEMHGGRLWAESTGVSGEGSTFFVELPVEARITETVEKQAK